jgi:hypothetical protein
MSIKSFIRNWLNSSTNKSDCAVSISSSGELDGTHVRFEIIDAMNGRIVRMGTYKPNPHGPDWTFKLYVMQDQQSVGDAVNLLLITKG